MTMGRNLAAQGVLALALSIACTGIAAQEAEPLPATPEACTSIASDALRLACYDTALGRKAEDTATADALAEYASLAAREAR